MALPFLGYLFEKDLARNFQQMTISTPSGGGIAEFILLQVMSIILIPIMYILLLVIFIISVLSFLMAGTALVQGALMTYMNKRGLGWVVQGILDVAGIASIVFMWVARD